jgi:uncharacterized protein RhaS with RHS repeats
MTRDPIGYGGGVNLYGYVGNNPVNKIDPDGTIERRTYYGDEPESHGDCIARAEAALEEALDECRRTHSATCYAQAYLRFSWSVSNCNVLEKERQCMELTKHPLFNPPKHTGPTWWPYPIGFPVTSPVW